MMQWPQSSGAGLHGEWDLTQRIQRKFVLTWKRLVDHKGGYDAMRRDEGVDRVFVGSG